MMDSNSYEKDLDELQRFRSKVSNISFYIFIFWGGLFLGFIIWWFFKEIMPDPMIGFALQSLNLMGGTFNIIIALTGVITVWLLSKAVSYQKEELIKIQQQMDSQRKSIEQEEKINRTIDLIYKWTSLDEYIGEPYTRGSSFDPEPREKSNYIGLKQTDFINHLMLIEKSSKEYKNKIDFGVVCKAILNDNAERGIEDKIAYIKLDLLKLNENNYNKFDSWDVEKIESLDNGSVEKFSLVEIQKYKKIITFLKKWS